MLILPRLQKIPHKYIRKSREFTQGDYENFGKTRPRNSFTASHEVTRVNFLLPEIKESVKQQRKTMEQWGDIKLFFEAMCT